MMTLSRLFNIYNSLCKIIGFQLIFHKKLVKKINILFDI